MGLSFCIIVGMPEKLLVSRIKATGTIKPAMSKSVSSLRIEGVMPPGQQPSEPVAAPVPGATGTVPASPEPPPVPKRPWLGWVKSYGWPLLCLFQVGLIVGAFFFGSRLADLAREESTPSRDHKGAQTSNRSLTVTAPSAADPPASLGPLARTRAARGELDEVDRLLSVGRYELALVLCRSFSERAIADLRDAFHYRLGLCLEGLGRWDEALTAYRKLSSRSAATCPPAIALLGQARVWLRMRRPADSKALLCDLIRRSAQPELRGQPFLEDAHYLLALAASLELLPNEPPGPFNDNPVIPLTSDWSLDRALEWCKAAGRRPPAGEDGPALVEEVVEVQRGDVAQVRIFAHQMPLTSLLDRVAEQARLRIEWSARAREQVEGRSVVVALERTSLPDALRVLTEPLGLVWSIHGDKLSFCSDEETAAERLRALRWDNARRTLHEALRRYPRHPLTPAAFLELGDLEAVTGHLDEALKWYTRLIREWPRSPLGVEAQYNLGLVRCRQGDRASARQAFYHVIDRAPAHELAPLAYWRVGRIYLDEGDAEQALSPLQRALRSGPGTPAQAAAVLTLAAAHLLTDNPRAANAILLEHRELINPERFRAATVFLDTLARFRAATDRRQRQREAGDLLTALLMARGDPILGPSGLVLMGQAYQEMGMHEEMVRVYEKALPSLRGALAAQLALALADGYSGLDRRDAAVAMYRRVIEGGASSGARHARLRLAEIALAEKKPQECLKSCRELLQEKAAVDVPVVLRMMASAYEQMGARDKAIRCLQGELPAD